VLTYIARRLVAMFGLLVALSIVVFMLFSALPADPAALTCGKSCTPEIIETNRARLGLDKPLTEQYVTFVKGLFVGREFEGGASVISCPAPALGYSFFKQECVTTLITGALPVTVALALGAFLLWMVFGNLSGVIAALRRGTAVDRGLTGFALIGYSFPSFFIAQLFIFILVIKWGWLPGNLQAYSPFAENPSVWIQKMLLGWVVLALLFAAFYTRLTRNQMLETLGEDFIRTARAKGLSERRVIGKHGLRAGLTPVVTAAGLDLGGLLGGAVIAETVLNLPGVGQLALTSTLQSDLPVITGTVLLAAAFIILSNLVVDVLYATIDPRVRLS